MAKWVNIVPPRETPKGCTQTSCPERSSHTHTRDARVSGKRAAEQTEGHAPPLRTCPPPRQAGSPRTQTPPAAPRQHFPCHPTHCRRSCRRQVLRWARGPPPRAPLCKGRHQTKGKAGGSCALWSLKREFAAPLRLRGVFSSSPVLQFSSSPGACSGLHGSAKRRKRSTPQPASPQKKKETKARRARAVGAGALRSGYPLRAPLRRHVSPPFSGDLVPQTAPDTARRATCRVFALTHHFISHFSHLLRPRRGTRASGQARTRESKLTIIADGLAHQRVRDNPKRCHGKGGFVLQARTRFGGWLSRRRRRRRPPGRRWWAAGRWTCTRALRPATEARAGWHLALIRDPERDSR